MNTEKDFYVSAAEAAGSEDATGIIQRLIDENPNRVIFFPDGEYVISSPILTPADPSKSVSLLLSDFAVIKASPGWSSGEAMIRLGGKDPFNTIYKNGSNYSLSGGIVDGSGVASAISIDSGRETSVRNLSVKHAKIGIHIKYGANSGSSDSDISGVNITGTGGTDSVGVLTEGHDNTLTNMRIANVFRGVELRSSGNTMRNIHPLYTLDYTDYENSCGFYDVRGNNWYSFAYSDQFANGFRFAKEARGSIMSDCFAFWYSPRGDFETVIRCDGSFRSAVRNLKLGFRNGPGTRAVLTAAEPGGPGFIDTLCLNHGSEADLGDQTFRDCLRGGIVC
ncbi:MAG: hypothetical protein K5647_03515 [Clostridiales bacterium]|nr:hypothetical protein [Clostridiales bacterium]